MTMVFYVLHIKRYLSSPKGRPVLPRLLAVVSDKCLDSSFNIITYLTLLTVSMCHFEFRPNFKQSSLVLLLYNQWNGALNVSLYLNPFS